MPNKMLIDASHPEETRVVVVHGSRIEEFDFESQDKKQLKGNIYLARVTRVEPSLQAAFVEYGGNRHGFLAFSEIHPDYYQIPVADRQAILRAEAEAAEEEEDERRRESPGPQSRPAQAPWRQGPRPRAATMHRAAPPATRMQGPPTSTAADDHDHDRRRIRSGSSRTQRRVRTCRADRVARASRERRIDTPKGSTTAADEAEDRRSQRRRSRRESPKRSSRPNDRPTTIAAAWSRTAARSQWRRAGDRIGRRRRRDGRGAQPPQAAAPPLQDPGSHQAPPDPAGAGRQGRARQQGRGAHHLSVARRPLLRADAQHRAWRRHLAQDHQCRRTASA